MNLMGGHDKMVISQVCGERHDESINYALTGIIDCIQPSKARTTAKDIESRLDPI